MRNATKRRKTGKTGKGGLLALLLTLCSTGEALAHIRLTMPVPRDTRDDHKDNTARDPMFQQPCGSVRSSAQTITDVHAGADLSVQWTETVDHTGCFYVDFASSDAGPFQMLAMIEDGASSTPKMWTQVVKVPAVAATATAVLRVRQYMSGTKACPTNPMAGISYFTCANVRVLASTSTPDGGTDTGGMPGKDAGTIDAAAGGTGGGAAGGGSTGGQTGTGGMSATGGVTATGGVSATGGGNPRTGGSSGTGGTQVSTGGANTGGTSMGSSGGGCAVVGSNAGLGGVALVILGLFLRAARSRGRRASR